jgi:nicotinamidase-related amidase
VNANTVRSALLLVDVLNPMDFPGGPALLKQAMKLVPPITSLRRRWRKRGLPVIFANDNQGRWRFDLARIVQLCTRDAAPGAPFARELLPEPEDYFVLKPQQSAFHGSPLQDLLDDLGVRRLVIAGLAGDGCVLATAIDANIRKFACHVPADCIASETAARNRRALGLLKDTLRIATGTARTVRV